MSHQLLCVCLDFSIVLQAKPGAWNLITPWFNANVLNILSNFLFATAYPSHFNDSSALCSAVTVTTVSQGGKQPSAQAILCPFIIYGTFCLVTYIVTLLLGSLDCLHGEYLAIAFGWSGSFLCSPFPKKVILHVERAIFGAIVSCARLTVEIIQTTLFSSVKQLSAIV